MNRSGLALTTLLASLPLVGCHGDGSAGANQSTLTYWGDVAPILYDKCVKCHQQGGIAPFRLDNYADAARNAPAMVVQTQGHTMPPYLISHDGSCGQFDDSDALSDAQIASIKQWAEGGKKEGTPVALATPKIPHLDDGTSYQTPTLAPVPQGGQLAEFDEYRCFPVDTALTKDQFITGYEVLPGNAAIVHHVIAFLIDPAKVTKTGKTNAQLMQELDAKDPDRVGWQCFGQAGDNVEVESAPVTWAPGQGPVLYPPNMGVAQKTTYKLVIQVHYNLADPQHRGESDSTTVKLRYADTVDRKLVFLLRDGLLETLYGKMPAQIPPGMADASYTWKMGMADLAPGLDQLPFVDLMAVIPHMHQRGRKSTLTLIGGDGTQSCAAHVDHWNFSWQKAYFYKTPPRLDPKTQVQLTCEYDTSADTMPVLPGWGTRNEMCLDMLMLALPPGV